MANRRNKNYFYAVVKGRTVGIFTEWSQCEESIHKYHNCVYKGHKTLDGALKFMAPSGFTCQNVIVYDEHMLPKKASDFDNKCGNCSSPVPSCADSDSENFDLSVVCVTNEKYDIDSEEAIHKTIDPEETIPKCVSTRPKRH